jgi:hypothetical protein
MSTSQIVSPDAAQPALSEPQRIINTYVAPTKTFNDVRRNASWWAPWLLMAVVGWGMTFMVAQKVGFEQVAENQLRLQPKAMERIEKLPPDQRARQMRVQVGVTKGIAIGFPIVNLIVLAAIAGILLLTGNFAAGGDLTYGRTLAVVVYASLPNLIKALLVIITLLAGVAPEGFTFQNPLASNLSILASPPGPLYTLLQSIDAFTIWTLSLSAIGLTCISKLKRGTAFGIVFGWWAVTVLIGVGFAAMFS